MKILPYDDNMLKFFFSLREQQDNGGNERDEKDRQANLKHVKRNSNFVFMIITNIDIEACIIN